MPFGSLYKPKNTGACCSTNLINEDGTFIAAGIEDFTKKVELAKCGVHYATVSVFGPQSSGKSTLLNHLFGTNFKVMDAKKGRAQTTRGVWIGRAVGIKPCTVVMDLEGSDGRERGEDDTAFEKQSALLALAVSDIVLINMWYQDIGREHAGSRPLLRTVFLAMKRLCTPHKKTLMFVIRDTKPKAELKILESILREDIEKIWNDVPVSNPQGHEYTFPKFFNVKVVFLSNYDYAEEEFEKEVSYLRQRFYDSIALGGLAAGDRSSVVPASDFAYSVQKLWEKIKENQDLDLPSHKVMVSTVRCGQIADEKFNSFDNNEKWHKLQKDVHSLQVPNFGQKLSSILNTCFAEYDSEVTYFDETVRASNRRLLEEKLLEVVQPSYLLMLKHCRNVPLRRLAADISQFKNKDHSVAIREFTKSIMSRFDEGCRDADITVANWDASKARDKLNLDASKEKDKLIEEMNVAFDIVPKLIKEMEKKEQVQKGLLVGLKVIRISLSILLIPMGLGGLDLAIHHAIEAAAIGGAAFL